MKTTLQAVSIALDVIYTNSLKTSSDQLPLSQLQKKSGVGIATFTRLRQELISRNLLLVFGQTRSQYTAWNTCKCKMNDTLAKDVYKKLHTSEVKREAKTKRMPIKMQYDEIISYMRSRGWTGTLTRVKESGLIRTIEEIEL